jgi:hypothetical protein
MRKLGRGQYRCGWGKTRREQVREEWKRRVPL